VEDAIAQLFMTQTDQNSIGQPARIEEEEEIYICSSE
jgi:hypothetical protein